jgi:hypothetical protein
MSSGKNAWLPETTDICPRKCMRHTAGTVRKYYNDASGINKELGSTLILKLILVHYINLKLSSNNVFGLSMFEQGC